MFIQDIPLSIMPINSREGTYDAKITGDPRDVAQAVDLLQMFVRYDRTNVKQLIADAVTEIARSLAWYGRAPYEISKFEGDESPGVELTSFTPRRLLVTPWFCVQVVPRVERDRLKKAFVAIPRRDVWIVDMPRSLGGYWEYRKILRRLARFHTAAPAFWMKDLEASGRGASYFDFSVYRRETEVLQCRITRRWGWNHRDLTSNNWTEFALFYRMMTFRASQALLREHILLELNSLLKRLAIKAEIEISGLATSENIFGLRSEMALGNISYAKAYEVTSV
ncbi:MULTISPECIES: hypothetical protein [unclassified Bradyrhizobium]